MSRPQGLAGPVTLQARGRDLRTSSDGATQLVDQARLDAEVAYAGRREILSISADPAVDGLEQLVGAGASSGFRRAVESNVDVASGSLLNLLLDDVPVALLVSGISVLFAGIRPIFDAHHPPHPDLCSGWRQGGTILNEIAETGSPGVPTGPDAAPLTRADDPIAWHELPEALPNSLCRHRRLDVIAGDGDTPPRFDSFFRDQHIAFGGRATSIHEYHVSGTLSADGATITAIEATPVVLPWAECDQAAPSATRLIGQPVTDLRRQILATFTGITTCTHLNDQLRSLADLPWLFGELSRSPR